MNFLFKLRFFNHFVTIYIGGKLWISSFLLLCFSQKSQLSQIFNSMTSSLLHSFKLKMVNRQHCGVFHLDKMNAFAVQYVAECLTAIMMIEVIVYRMIEIII